MTRQRVNTTVDDDLLTRARRLRAWRNDAALIDAALGALIALQRAAEVDEAYSVYDERPLDEPDEWGDLATFRAAASGAQ